MNSLKQFNLAFIDTDSITFNKPNGEAFLPQECIALQEELNTLFPEKIRWEHNFYASKVLVLRTKNYIVYDPDNENPRKKLIYKGSAVKASTKEPALKEFIKAIINAMLHDQTNFEQIYLQYAKEALNVQDMKRWASRKTISDKVLKNSRTNEVKVRDAIEGTDYVEGDRVYLYFKPDKTLGLLEYFNGEYCKISLLKKLFSTAQLFEHVLNTKTLFPNLALKRNQNIMEELCKN